MNYAKGDLRQLLDNIELEELTTKDSGQKAFDYIKGEYSEYIVSKKPLRVEDSRPLGQGTQPPHLQRWPTKSAVRSRWVNHSSLQPKMTRSKKMSNKIHGLIVQKRIHFRETIPGLITTVTRRLREVADSLREQLHTQDLGQTTLIPGR